MSFDYIASYYGLDFQKGDKVNALDVEGEVTGADGQYVLVRKNGFKHSYPFHATDVSHMIPKDMEPQLAQVSKAMANNKIFLVKTAYNPRSGILTITARVGEKTTEVHITKGGGVSVPSIDMRTVIGGEARVRHG